MKFPRRGVSLIIVSLFIVIIFTNLSKFDAQMDDESIPYTISSTQTSSTSIINFDNFSNFELQHDCPDVSTTITDSSISFIGSTGSDTVLNDDAVIMHLGGDYQDFNLTVALSYVYTGTMIESLGVEVGSYYYEDGTYRGPPVARDFQPIAGVEIQDGWAASGGQYSAFANPFDSWSYEQTDKGTISNTGTLSYSIIRIGNSVTCTIKKSDAVVLSKTWTSGLSRYANHIIIYCTTSSYYVDTTEGTFTDILGTFELISYHVTEPPTNINPSNYQWVWVGIGSGVLIISTTTIVIVLNRRRTRLKISSPEITHSETKQQEADGYTWAIDE